MTFEIEKGIEYKATEFRSSKYPFRQMEVGDSFFIPEASDTLQQGRVITASYNVRIKIPGFKIKTKQENGGLRVWRVA